MFQILTKTIYKVVKRVQKRGSYIWGTSNYTSTVHHITELLIEKNTNKQQQQKQAITALLMHCQ